LRRTTVWATALSALVLGMASGHAEAKPSGKAVASAIALTPSSEFSAPTVKVSAREARLVSAIQQTYQFRERSERVRVLQRLLSNVDVDGYYGSQTRKAHIQALEARGLTTAHVPAVTYPASSGPRFPDDQSMRCPKWEAKFREYGLPVEVFSYIAWRESKCNPKAVNARWNSQGVMTYALNKNGTWDSGLVQINSSWIRTVREVCNVDTGSMRQDLEALLKVDCNLKMAKWIMDNTSGKLRNWSIYGGQ
jgi:peptidoglycan hydrolase-like protein with peptidoglycan-binding domain